MTALDEVVSAFNGTARPQQKQMFEKTAEIWDAGLSGIVEAGTGTGKSFAYLSSIVDQYRKYQQYKTDLSDPFVAVVATSSIALQQQLISKDLPAVVAAAAPDLKFGIYKGKNNYVCPMKVAVNGEDIQEDLFSSESEGVHVAISAARNGLTDKQEAPKEVLTHWQEISSTSDECLGKTCDYWADCPSAQAHARLDLCQIIVTNHHLYGMHISGVPVLPDHRFAVIDEAHKFSDIVGSVNSIVLDSKKFELATKKLFSNVPSVGNLVNKLRSVFNKNLSEAVKTLNQKKIPDVHVAWDHITELRDIAHEIDQTIGRNSGRGKGKEYQLAVKSWASLSDAIAETRQSANTVVWCDVRKFNGETKVKILCSQISPTKVIADSNRKVQTLYTSATLHARMDRELGMDGSGVVRVGSPFNYSDSVMCLDMTLPEPSETTFRGEADKIIKKFIEASGGACLVLFTSYKAMQASHEYLSKHVDTPLIMQGEAGHGDLSERFKADPSTTLLGTLTFWEGVDFPGDTLKTVVIDKIPFPNFKDPLGEAKREKLGGFHVYDIPKAETMLLQGVGRLIRTESDTGVVALLDKRIKTKKYGKTLVRNLPDFKRTTSVDAALAVLKPADQGVLL